MKKTRRERELEAKRAVRELKKAAHDGVSAKQILAEDQTVTKLGLPTDWKNADKPVGISGPQAIIEPNSQQIAAYADTEPRKVCGQCKHHDLEKGRKELERQSFIMNLVMDNEWAIVHLGAPLDTIGLCAMDPTMVSSAMGVCCDQFYAKK